MFNAISFNCCFCFSSCQKGETGANVLVGIQVAQTEMDEFQFRANNLGYDYVIETDNEAFRLLVQWVVDFVIC